MIYIPIPRQPGIAGVTLPNGGVTVYYFVVQTQGTIHIEADVTSGVGPVTLELHLYTYPAINFVVKNTFIEAVMPTGTHYVAVRTTTGGTGYRIWDQRITNCPAGCVAATKMIQVVREVAHNIHRKNGLPPPTPEDILEATPPHARPPAVADVRPDVRPDVRDVMQPPTRRSSAGTTSTQPLSVHVLVVGGPPVRVTLTAEANAVQFVSHISQRDDYEFLVMPGPLVQQELFYLTLLRPDDTVVRSSTDGVLAATLTIGTWKSTFEVPRDMLGHPRTFAVSLMRTPSQRPGLDHPPRGDGQYAVGSTILVDIASTHPKAQLYGDIATADVYAFTCTEITGAGAGSPQADAPAILAVYDNAGGLAAGAVQPGDPVTIALAAGRWWVDIVVPDFHQRATPRRYALRVATDTA